MAETKSLTARIAELNAEVDGLRTQVGLLTELVQGIGIESWLTPAQAAAFLGVSRDMIVRDIREAEGLRRAGKKSDFVLGTHYRPKRANANVPRWQVNVLKWREVMAIAPEKRCVG
ncbi:hypothetical protein NDA01_21825 [Trichocoleus desertorum AS-A10]|uniref:hypothetical protein n=1 Tax=Trichocoleus desertorum TaxID=1481672 RepID=UPI00329882A3